MFLFTFSRTEFDRIWTIPVEVLHGHSASLTPPIIIKIKKLIKISRPSMRVFRTFSKATNRLVFEALPCRNHVHWLLTSATNDSAANETTWSIRRAHKFS